MSSAKKTTFTTSTIILSLLIVCLPFIKSSSETLVDFELIPKHIAIGLTTITLISLNFKNKLNKSVLNIATLGMLLFLVANFISLSVAVNHAEAWATISRYSIYTALLFVLIVGLYNKTIDLNIIAKATVIFSLTIGVISLFNLIEAYNKNDVLNSIYQIRTFYTHKNFLASALLLSLPLVIFQVIKNEKVFGVLAKITLAIATLDILMLRTRGVWLALIGSAIVVLAIYFVFSKKELDQKRWMKFFGLGTAGFIVVLTAVIFMSQLSESVFNLGSLDVRTRYWANSLEMIQEKPLTGVGAGNWKIAFPKYGLSKINITTMEGQTAISRPHNDLIWIVSEGGILALIGFLVFLKSSYWFGIKAFKTTTDYNEKWISLLALMGMVAFVIYGLFEFPIERADHSMFFILYAAIAISMYLKYHNPKSIKVSLQPLMAVLLCLGLFSTYVVSNRLSSAKSAKKALTALSARMGNGMISSGNNALSTYYNVDDFVNPMHYYTGMGYLTNKNLQLARAEFEQALADHPNHILSHIQLGNTYKYEAKYNQALVEYRKVLSFAKLNQTALLNVAEVYAAQKDFAYALHVLNYVRLDPKNQKFGNLAVQCVLEMKKLKNDKRQRLLLDLIPETQDPQTVFNAYMAARKTLANNNKIKKLEINKVPEV